MNKLRIKIENKFNKEVYKFCNRNNIRIKTKLTNSKHFDRYTLISNDGSGFDGLYNLLFQLRNRIDNHKKTDKINHNTMSGNKFALSVELIGKSDLELEFYHWDKRFLSTEYTDTSKRDYKFAYFQSNDEEFCIYSHDKGYILDNGQYGFVVPDEANMKSGAKIKHNFINDDERYDYLKKLYKYLKEFCITCEQFKSDGKPKHKFVVHDKFWIY